MAGAGYILDEMGVLKHNSRKTKKKLRKNKNRLKMIKSSKKQNRKCL